MIVKCLNEECDVEIPSKDFNLHLERCQFRLVECCFCKEKKKFLEMKVTFSYPLFVTNRIN